MHLTDKKAKTVVDYLVACILNKSTISVQYCTYNNITTSASVSCKTTVRIEGEC